MNSFLEELADEVAAGPVKQAALEPAKDAYNDLPESIKAMYTRKEWMWLSDKEKVGLVHHECEPESFND